MADSGGWTPEIAQAWIRILASFLAAGCGAFMLIWQTVFAMTPNALIVGAGLIALGLPPAVRGITIATNGDRGQKDGAG